MPNIMKMIIKKRPTFRKFGRDFINVFARCLSLSNYVIFLSGCNTLIALIDFKFVELVDISISLYNLYLSSIVIFKKCKIYLPKYYDYEIYHVPPITHVGIFPMNKTLRDDF
jgi:hypothetical protein